MPAAGPLPQGRSPCTTRPGTGRQTDVTPRQTEAPSHVDTGDSPSSTNKLVRLGNCTPKFRLDASVASERPTGASAQLVAKLRQNVDDDVVVDISGAGHHPYRSAIHELVTLWLRLTARRATFAARQLRLRTRAINTVPWTSSAPSEPSWSVHMITHSPSGRSDLSPPRCAHDSPPRDIARLIPKSWRPCARRRDRMSLGPRAGFLEHRPVHDRGGLRGR